MAKASTGTPPGQQNGGPNPPPNPGADQQLGGENNSNNGENNNNLPPEGDKGGENLSTITPEANAGTSSPPPAPGPKAPEAPVMEAKQAPEKTVAVRCLVTDSCDIGGQVYKLKEKQTINVPAGVCAILQNSNWVIKL